MKCVFCAIAAGTSPARIVYENDRVVAFFPLGPATEGHTLVVPKEHVETFLDLDGELSDAVFRAAVHVGNAIKRALGPDGMNLITSAGEEAEQTVPHLHVHLVPRDEDQEFDPIWKKSDRVDEDVDLDALADRVREQF